jgi:hypothetical protein
MSTNSIIYALVGFGEKPLSSYSEFKGTFQKQCQNYLRSVDINSSGGYKLDDYFIFYLNENGLTYLIMTDMKYSKASALACLESIKKEFLASFPDTDFDSIEEFGLDKDFKQKLKMKYEYYNENKEVINESTQKLMDEIFKMKDDVLNASDLLNERNDKLNNVKDKAETLAETSYKYRTSATKVKKSTIKKKVLISIGIAFAVLAIGYFIVVMACGWNFNCKGD